LLLGTGPGDIVIVQSFTFSATVNPVIYCGATPVFVDSEPDTWNMDPDLLEEAIIKCMKGELGQASESSKPVRIRQ
jgi:dTDP-4-amino-4,6-dideoxygalactose transaminase